MKNDTRALNPSVIFHDLTPQVPETETTSIVSIAGVDGTLCHAMQAWPRQSSAR